ncbi:MAG: hypothetical protein HZA01_02495 [Nitrospinae bacterium]|nr:hypothetical protein [Nitrospinota bacterium]
MKKSTLFKLGKQSVKLFSENTDFLKDMEDLLLPFLKKDNNEDGNTSFRALFPAKEKGGHSLYAILRDGKEVFQTDEPFRLVFRLEWLIVKLLLQGIDFLQFHSGVAAKDGKAILFPAEANSGKSTLTVALSQAGFQIYSDEVALIDPDSFLVTPFPRNIHIDEDMKEVFSRLGYDLKFRNFRWKELEGDNLEFPWRKLARSRKKESKARLIIFPKYSPKHANRLQPVTSGEAFARILENEINFNRFRAKGMDIVEGLLKGADCYRLETGDLSEAAALIKELFDSLN